MLCDRRAGRRCPRRPAPAVACPTRRSTLLRRILGGDLRGALGRAAGARPPPTSSASRSPPSSTTSSAGCAAPPCSDPLIHAAAGSRNPFGERKVPGYDRIRLHMSRSADLMDRVVNLAKRRGLVFPSSEIYGGFRSTWDYGPLGVLLKRNVKDAWWRSMVQLRDDVVGLDAAILMAPKVWEASGHLATLHRPARRLPQLQGALPRRPAARRRVRARTAAPRTRSPRRGSSTSCSRRTSARSRTTPSVAYLRPETAQGIFVNFENVQTTTRKKPPFGIAQIGKSFRNEITPGNFIFRTREFEQMEMEFFVPPEDGAAVGTSTGARSGSAGTSTSASPRTQLRLRPHDADELSHYSVGTSDVEFDVPVGLGRARGHRQPHRLRPHASTPQFSGEDLSYYDQENDRRYVPYVIEPAARRRPRDARVPARRLRRGGGAERQGRHRDAHGAAPPPAPRADQGRGAAAVEERAAGAGGRRGRRRCCGRTS